MTKVTKQGSTLFLKFVVCLIGITVLALCIFVLPPLIATEEVGYYRPILYGLYVTAIPFFIALYQALKLLRFIEKNKTFSGVSVKTLKNIKYCAIAISALFTVGIPYIYYAAKIDDAPGVMLIGLVIIFASLVIATASGVFQRLLQNAVDMKAENDLTV